MKDCCLWSVLVLFLISGCGGKKRVQEIASAPLFHLLEPEQTGIRFGNRVEDKADFNILTYRNFYNGGGVAIGDVNNDGLPDLYFTANQQPNKLYLNKGNFRFEDITEQAGVAGTMAWSTGVTMADVNGDGLLDIYVCNSGDVDGNRKKNELFINQGNLRFSEQARQFNLDNEGYSTHAAFFDYDSDGDLDCYILNNSFRDPGKIELYKKVREIASPGGHKLMRNDGAAFTDVTREAGIFSSDIAFGLGVSVSDLNGDHLPDIYVSNDFWERDYLYMNKGNGTFSEELPQRVNYTSLASMGADIADINNDGAPEIFTTDMLPADNYRLKTTMSFDPYHLEDLKYRANYHYQFTQNCLHLNDGKANFSEIALLSGVSATDWSWGALIFDFENDGNKDIFVSNGILRDIGSMDFVDFHGGPQSLQYATANSRPDFRKMIESLPSMPLQNYAFTNKGGLEFQNNAAALGLSQKTFSNGAAYGDLDNDGDLDLVVNNNNAPGFVYRNDAAKLTGNHFLKVKFAGMDKNPLGIGAVVELKTREGSFVLQNFNTRGFQSSIEPILLFGLGRQTLVDSLIATWPDGRMQLITQVNADQVVTLQHQDAGEQIGFAVRPVAPLYADITPQVLSRPALHAENRYNDFDVELLSVRMLSTEGPQLVTGDVNGDKRTDFLLLGAAGDPEKMYLQLADSRFQYKPVAAFNKLPASFESTCGAFFDFDGDGDQDLLIGSGGNEAGMDKMNFIVRAYANDGLGNFSIAPTAAPRVVGNFATLQANDVDQDGDMDLFLGARNVPGNYGLRPRSFLLMNESGVWSDVTPAALADIGMVTDAAWADTDGDGDKDLVVVGDWMSVHVFANNRGSFSEPATVPHSSGWWNRIQAADLDADGDTDFVLGNWGLNTHFKAVAGKPLSMYVADFDNNGKSEPIINWYPPGNGNAFPFATKPELTTQLPGLKKQMLRYADYGRQSFESLFAADTRSQAQRYEAEYLQTSVLRNNKGQLALEALPLAAQMAPVFGIAVADFDGDETNDIWLGGNFYALKPQAGRHNASKGLLLKGSKTGGFTAVPAVRSGMQVAGEVRQAVVLEGKMGKYLLVARNNAGVVVLGKR